tara:strand:+ start:879 stop:2705 length:1827 start_codon:yes stop_codon:yes gene_type:complete
MKRKLSLILLFYFIFFNTSISEEIKVIDLNSQLIDDGLLKASQTNLEENENSDVIEINNEQNDISEEQISETEDIVTSEIVNENSEDTLAIDEIVSLSDYWEKGEKEEITFLFENLIPTKSSVLNDALINFLKLDSKPPQNFNQIDFNNLKIINLIKLGERKSAFNMINFLSQYEDMTEYDLFKLNFYFSSYELNEACDFSKTINNKISNIDKNYLLKVDIFCSFIQNKIAEADFLNSLLQDTNDKDSYFQEIYLNLKNDNNLPVNATSSNFDKNSMSLYSAMIRMGDMPLNEKFLEYDSDNLSNPIILSRTSDISLRLKAAHKAYKNNKFDAESLSALYQTVDFSSKELNDSEFISKKLENNFPTKMAYYFQRVKIQLLPITRIQALVDFWQFADTNNLDVLAYDISRKYIDTIEPSSELSEFGIKIARAHIYNNNFDLADKWILFSKNYQSNESNFETEMKSLKLLYNLKNSKKSEEFKNILIANLYEIDSVLYKEFNKKTDNQEILLTILSVINKNNKNLLTKNRKLIDKREMPSSYIINNIKNSYESKNYGEMILSINVSVRDKKWNDIHPEHLKVILTSLQDSITEEIFIDIILEILNDTNII